MVQELEKAIQLVQELTLRNNHKFYKQDIDLVNKIVLELQVLDSRLKKQE